MAITKSDVTKTMLEKVVKVFNKEILDRNDQLPTGKKRGETKSKLEKELVSAANELLQKGDEKFFDEFDIDVMIAIGIDFGKLTGWEAGKAEEEIEEEIEEAETEETGEAEEELTDNEDEIIDEGEKQGEVVTSKKTEKNNKKKSDDKKKASGKKRGPKEGSARYKVFTSVKKGKMTKEKVVQSLDGDVPKKLVNMYLRAWEKGDRCPEGEKMVANSKGILSFK